MMDIYGILALVFGMIGTITSYWYIGLIPGVIGVVLGLVGMTDDFSDKKFSLIGLLVSIFGIVASVYVFASDLDSEKLVIQMNKFDQEDTVADDSFMRFHQEGWTPEQAGEEVRVAQRKTSETVEEDPPVVVARSEERAVERETSDWDERVEDPDIADIENNGMSESHEDVATISVQPREPEQSATVQEEINESEEHTENVAVNLDDLGRWVVYKDNNIAIAYDGMYRNDSPEGYNIKLVAANLSDKTLTIQCKETAVNGYMVEPMCSIEVASGGRSGGNITVYGEDAKKAPYGSISSVETKFIIIANNNVADSYQTENVIIKRSGQSEKTASIEKKTTNASVQEPDVVGETTAVVETPPAPVENAAAPAGSMVWLSATGEKYHSINNCGRMNPDRARLVTLEEAIGGGFEACSKCW